MKYAIRRKINNEILSFYKLPIIDPITNKEYYASDITTDIAVELIEVPDDVQIGQIYT